MHFGMPALLECLSLEENLLLCSSLGLDFVELNMNLPEYQLDQLDADAARRLFQRFGKYPTIHLEENLNAADFNTAVAGAYLHTVLGTIALAKEIETPIITMHMAEGVYFTLPDRKEYLFGRYITRYLDSLRRFRDASSAALDGSGILLCVENCGAYRDFQREGIDVLLESPRFALTYDAGHDFCDAHENKAFILSRGERLRHLHLHDAGRHDGAGPRCHLALGTGEIDIAETLALAEKYGCRTVLEIKTTTALRQSVEYLQSVSLRAPCTRGVPGESAAAMPNVSSAAAVTDSSPNDDKLRLFYSLFRGREDVYARRWESRDGQKSGYAPVCRNEWAQDLCEKPKIKCADCANRDHIPLDTNVLARHLAGREIAGVYPLLPDGNCLFLAIDFDGDGWREDAAALRTVAQVHGIPTAVERSRSGRGAHMWFFFEEPVSAYSARKFGSALLTAAMEYRHTLRFSSYDRLFPNQDTVPKGGFGNLIALPLQREARNIGNSVFTDEHDVPYADQWAFLSGLRRLNADSLRRFTAALGRGGELGPLRPETDAMDDMPWKAKPLAPLPERLSADDFPGEIRVVIANMLFIEKSGFSSRALNRLKRLAAFRNPEFYKAQAMRLSTWDKPRVICIAEETGRYLCLPRGLKNEVEEIAGDVPIRWQDERNGGRGIDVEFTGVLREEQAAAEQALLLHDTGILSAATAFGKTVVAAALIAARKVNTLILVNRQPLLLQWETRLTEFLSIHETLPEVPKKRGGKKRRSGVGLLGGGRDSTNGILDVAIIQSLVRGDSVKDIVKNYGMVIVDECHHVSAVSFERVLKEVTARYVYGLTATPKRQDGHQPIVTMHCGGIRYTSAGWAESRPFTRSIIPRFTPYRLPHGRDDMRIQDIYADLCGNAGRNDMILTDILRAVSEGRNPLVLSERKAHVDMLAKALRERVPNVIVLTGGQPSAARKHLLEQIASLPENEPLVLIATGKYIGEGFDAPRLDTLFLAMPIAWQGTLAQYAGRLHRLHGGKDEVRIYDYIDVHAAVLERMYAKRVRGYKALGYTAKCEDGAPSEEKSIFAYADFLPAFTADILAAKREVIIVSPVPHQNRISKMAHIFEKCVSSGVEVRIITRPAGEYAEKGPLRPLTGISVIEKPKLHQKFAVVDGRIVWYGSVNLLGFGSAQESVIRLESAGIAAELMDALESAGQGAAPHP